MATTYYSAGYPIIVPISYTTSDTSIPYTISIGNTLIYNGLVQITDYTKNSLNIDIQPVIINYIDCLIEYMNITDGVYPLPSLGLISEINTFTVSYTNSSGTTTSSYSVCYDFNTDYIQPLGFNSYLSVQIDNKITNNVILPFSCFNYEGNIILQRNSAQIASYAYSGNGIEVGFFDLSKYTLNNGDILTITDGTNILQKYTVFNQCQYPYQIIYLNKYGGIDTIIAYRGYEILQDAEKTKIRIHGDRLSKLDFHNKIIEQKISRKIKITTASLPNDSEKTIDNLLFSPKIYLRNMNTGNIISVFIENESFTINRFPKNNLVSYQLTFVESQLMLR